MFDYFSKLSRRCIAGYCVLTFFAPAIVGAASGSGRSLVESALASEQPQQIVIDNFSFGPASLTVKAGTTVTWINHDDIPHAVVDDSDARLFKSSALDTDESFSHTFDHAGIFKYFCSLHPKMQGTVVVQ